ncbi:MAG: hypothetical protein M3P94_05245 [Chloroflexota bacterium]|nr:hypothetical protein [Chloroflexia bacterium]MDQ3168036.1 hypothetical protein [Chloroflexota bacterium]
MADDRLLMEESSLQDRDLLQRLSLYFDALDSRLRQGQGWFIFNARGGRSGRIMAFIQERVLTVGDDVSSCIMPWKEFALSAYVREVGLPELAPAVDGNSRVRHEYDLASQITRGTQAQMLNADLLVLSGLRPTHRHEALVLDETLEGRYRQRLATIVLVPDQPQALEAEFRSVDPSRAYWDRLFHRMYETSLIAV